MRLLPIRLPIAALILLSFAGAVSAKDSCLDCHKVMEGTSIPFQNDIHFKKGLSCADCHGGDPTASDQNISMSPQKGFRTRVTREGVAEFCGRCHSDAAFMKKHNPKEPVNQAKIYAASVHASKPAGSDDIAATCVDCHSVHNTRAVSDPQSTVAPARLARTCGKCHGDSSAAYQKSAHAAIFVTGDKASCTVCHSGHATARVTDDLLAGGHDVCSKCHEPDSKGGRAAASLGRAFENARMAAFAAMAPRADVPRGGAATGGTDVQGRGGAGAAGAQGRGATPAVGRGFRATSPAMRKAMSTVHGLDVPAVKAALEVATKQ